MFYKQIILENNNIPYLIVEGCKERGLQKNKIITKNDKEEKNC